ncbi:MAG: DUF501 domain-containing protein [Miltoncostaeaceae bacterium]
MSSPPTPEASPPTEADRRIVAHQLGRPSIAEFRVAVRCPHGAPAVLANGPRDRRGHPFPTRNWLSCGALATGVSRLEARGGAKSLEADAAMVGALRDAQRAHARLHDGHLVAGAAETGHAKCLHAHLAFALAEGGNPVGEWIWERAGLAWPEECCSTSEAGE